MPKSEWKRLRGPLKPGDVHPETGKDSLTESVEIAEKMLEHVNNVAIDGDYEASVQDALTNLIHLCDREDMDFQFLLERARRMADWEAGIGVETDE